MRKKSNNYACYAVLVLKAAIAGLVLTASVSLFLLSHINTIQNGIRKEEMPHEQDSSEL